jgi:hypothetical protein
MIILGTPWFQQALVGNTTVIGILGTSGSDNSMIGQRVTVQHAGETTERFEVLITNIIHYDSLVEFIAGEGYQNIAPQTHSLMQCEAALLSIYLGRTRVFNPNQVRARGGINAWRIELLSLAFV